MNKIKATPLRGQVSRLWEGPRGSECSGVGDALRASNRMTVRIIAVKKGGLSITSLWTGTPGTIDRTEGRTVSKVIVIIDESKWRISPHENRQIDVVIDNITGMRMRRTPVLSTLPQPLPLALPAPGETA